MGNNCLSVDHIKSYQNKKKAFGMKGLNVAITAGRNTATVLTKNQSADLIVDDMPIDNKENNPVQSFESNAKPNPKVETQEKAPKIFKDDNGSKEQLRHQPSGETKPQKQTDAPQEMPHVPLNNRTGSYVAEKKPIEEELADALRSNRDGNTECEHAQEQLEQVQMEA